MNVRVQRGVGVQFQNFFNFGVIWGWAIIAMPWQLCSWEGDSKPIVQLAMCASGMPGWTDMY